MSLTSLVPIVEPLAKLIAALLENAFREDDPARYLRRKAEAELLHKAMQEAARKALERTKP